MNTVKELREAIRAEVERLQPPAGLEGRVLAQALHRRHDSVGTTRRGDLHDRKRIDWLSGGTRQAVTAALIVAVLVAALGAFVVVHSYVQRSTPAQTQHHTSKACSQGNLHMVSATVGWNGTSRTVDGGATWYDFAPAALRGQTSGGHATCAIDGNHLWVTQVVGASDSTEGNLYVWFTADGGRSWATSDPLAVGGSTPGIQLDFIDVRHGWMVTTGDLNSAVGNDVVVYTTIDGGATWKQLARSSDPNEALAQFAGCTGPTGLTFVDSHLGWMTWDCIHQSFPVVEAFPPVLVTLDGGRTWLYAITADLRPLLQAVAPGMVWSCGAAPPVFTGINGAMPVACGAYGTDAQGRGPVGTAQLLWAGTLVTHGATVLVVPGNGASNAGMTWTAHSLPVGVDLSKIDFVDANNGFAFAFEGATNDLYRTTDGGEHWLMTAHAVLAATQGGTCNFKNLPDCAGTSAPPVTNFEFVDTQTGFAFTSLSTVAPWRTLDGGRTWLAPTTP